MAKRKYKRDKMGQFAGGSNSTSNSKRGSGLSRSARVSGANSGKNSSLKRKAKVAVKRSAAKARNYVKSGAAKRHLKTAAVVGSYGAYAAGSVKSRMDGRKIDKLIKNMYAAGKEREGVASLKAGMRPARIKRTSSGGKVYKIRSF